MANSEGTVEEDVPGHRDCSAQPVWQVADTEGSACVLEGLSLPAIQKRIRAGTGTCLQNQFPGLLPVAYLCLGDLWDWEGWPHSAEDQCDLSVQVNFCSRARCSSVPRLEDLHFLFWLHFKPIDHNKDTWNWNRSEKLQPCVKLYGNH